VRSRSVFRATAIATAAYILVARPRQLRWGATNEESEGPLPGDDLIENADLIATRSITIRAADQVWPWIAQLGQRRGGFYSCDFLENLVGCDIHSADRIVPEWQDVVVGDEVRFAPEVGLAVASLEQGRSLVLRGGVPIGNTAPPYDFTWAFVLRDEPDKTTRLLLRERLRVHATVGAAHRRADRSAQLRDEPEDASRDQGTGRTSSSMTAPALLSNLPSGEPRRPGARWRRIGAPTS
jgi:hypothetical protein